MFARSFGIELEISRDGDTQRAVQPISSYEHTMMFNLIEEISLKLAELDFFHLLEAEFPGKNSASLINCVYERLMSIRKDLSEIFEPEVDAPYLRARGNKASTSPEIVFFNAVGAKFPSDAAWKASYSTDKECSLIMDLIGNPYMIKKPNVEKLYYSYRGPIRRKLIIMNEGMIILKEPIRGESTYRELRIITRDIRQIVFIQFHAKPIGGHFGLHNTVVRIMLRFFWHGLNTFFMNMISRFDVCALAVAMTLPSTIHDQEA